MGGWIHVFYRLKQAAESMSFQHRAETGPNSYVIPAEVGGQRLGIYSCWGRHSWLLPSLARLP